MTAVASDPVIVREVVVTIDITVVMEARGPLAHPPVLATATSPLPKPLVHPEIHTVKARLPTIPNSATCETLLTVTKNRVTVTIGVTVIGLKIPAPPGGTTRTCETT